MKPRSFELSVLFSVLVLAGSAQAQEPGPAAAASPLRITPNFPTPVEGYRGASVKLEFDVLNASKDALTISSIFPRKGEGAGRAEPAILAPGSKGRILLSYTLPETLGKDQVNFLVKTDDKQSPTQVIRIPYFVQTAYEPEFSVLDFGDMHAGQRLQTRLRVSSLLVTDLQFTKVVAKPDWLDVAFAKPAGATAQQADIVATTNRMPAYGLTTGEVVLESNVRENPQLRLPVIVRTFSKYRVSPFPVSLGGVPEGLDRKTTLRINRIGDGEVRLKGIDPGSPALKIDPTPCGRGCLDLAVSFDSMRARKSLRAVMKVQFEDDEVVLQVPIDALVVPIGVQIIDLGNLDDITVKSKTTTVERK